MDKNVLIAFLVSTVVIMGYYFLFPPQNRNTQVAEPNPKIQAELKQTKEFPTIAEKKLNAETFSPKTPSKTIEINSDLYQAKISTAGGSLESFILQNYDYSSKPRINVIKTIWNTILGRRTVKRNNPQRSLKRAN